VRLSVGQHVVTVKYADVDVNGSPFYPQVFDPSQVWVSRIPPTAVRDQPVNFDGWNNQLALYVTSICIGCLAKSFGSDFVLW